MTNKDRLLQMIDNLNEDGIELISKCFKDMDKSERYNINTTPERLEELQQIQLQKDKQREEQLETDNWKASYERAQERYRIMKEKKTSLTGKEKRLFEVIESVDTGYYYMETWELLLLSDIYDNNLINGSIDLFNYGFLKGQRAEKARQKRLREKARAC